MTRRGPKPTPTRLRVIRGEWDSRIMLPEPQAEEGECPSPSDMPPIARQTWDALAPELERKGLLAPRYAFLFRAFCSAVEGMVRAEQLRGPEQPLIVGTKGQPVANPASREFRHYAQLARQLGTDFGLTPAAVTQIGRAAGENGLGGSGHDPSRLLG